MMNHPRLDAPLRGFATLAFAAALALGAPPLAAQEQDGEETATATVEAHSWRFLDGPGVSGVLRLSDAVGPNARGFFVVSIAEKGVFEGVYNLKEDGLSAIGMFWAEGRLNQGSVAGFLDIGADGVGGVSFLDGGEVGGLRAR